MPHEETHTAPQPLGELLREHRTQQGASLEDVSQATRISLPILRAIEDDDYERMPAEAFCRGFYTLYAKFLKIDAKEVLHQFESQQGIEQKSSKPSKPPIKRCQSSTNYAEPSAISPGTSMTFLLLTTLLIFAGICWYLNWNPLDYINSKLAPTLEQGFSGRIHKPTTPYQTEEEQSSKTEVAKISSPLPPQPQTASPGLSSMAEVALPDSPAPEIGLAATAAAPYIVEFYCTTSSTIKVTLDDGFVLEKHLNAGETQRWEAENTLVLDMPETSDGSLHLNGIEIPLPHPLDGRRILSLPEDLLNIN
jgi:cytoskeletal protein RodZ